MPGSGEMHEGGGAVLARGHLFVIGKAQISVRSDDGHPVERRLLPTASAWPIASMPEAATFAASEA